jgi:ParB-like chromosome segregation protein Spo0J
MAMSLPIENKRGADVFFINPADVVVDNAANGRFGNHTETDIARLAKLIREYGQQQPVGIYKDGDTAKLAFGYRRLHASLLNNQGKQPGQAGYIPLKAVVVKGNADDHYMANLTENDHVGMTHMDYAYNASRMQSQLGWTQAKIADFFGQTTGWVHQHVTLMNLSKEWRDKVHVGEISLMDAYHLAKESEASQSLALETTEHAVEAMKELDAFDFLNQSTAEPVNEETASPAEAKIAANKRKKVEVKKQSVKRKVAAEVVKAVTGKGRAAVPASKRNIEVAAIGKRSWRDLQELFLSVGPTYSRRLQCLTEILVRTMDGTIREDEECLGLMESLLNNPAFETYSQLTKKASASAQA